MVVCICENINEKTIKDDFSNGMMVDTIIEKYNCNNCRCCNEYIRKLFIETQQEINNDQ